MASKDFSQNRHKLRKTNIQASTDDDTPMQNDDLLKVSPPAPAGTRFPSGSAMRLVMQAGQLLRALVDIPFRFIFGRDVFISYSRRDARKYVPNLVRALQERMPKLSIYLDRWIAPPAGKLPVSLRLQLRWSSILVLVCTKNAMGSEFVKDEVTTFARLGRKIVLVDVDGAYSAVRGEMPWVEISGADPEAETRSIFETSRPSDEVIDRIIKSIQFTIQDRRLRRATVGTLAFVVLSVGGTALYSRYTIKAANETAARAESRATVATQKADDADARAVKAEERVTDANRRVEEAGQREVVANQKREIAEGREREASHKAATAEGLRVVAENRASEARVEAQKQENIAVARRLAAESNLAEDPHLEQIEKKVLFNVESMRRSPSAVAYRNLIEGIKMMPQPQQTVSHDGKVNLLTFSPRGSLMATAVDNVLWLRNVTNLPLRKSIDGPVKIQHAGTVSRIEFSPDGKYLATVVRNEGVRIWQVEGMRELPPIPQKNTVAIAFSHDGKRIVIGGRGANLDASDFQKTASVWELDGNVREVATVETKSPVIDVSFDSNGKLFTTLNQSDESEPFLNFWNAAGGLQRKPANAPVKASGDALRGGFSPSGKHVAVVSQVDRKGAQVWNTDNGKVVLTNRQLEFIQFSPDGRFLVTSSADDESDNRRTYIWDVTGDSLREVRHINYRSIIREGAFSPDGKYLALVSLEQESVQVWDPVVGRVVAYMKIKERNPQIAFNEDGSFLAISAGNDVTLWPITDDWQNSFVKHTGKASAISADGKLMAVTNGSVVQLLNTRDQAMFSSIETPCRVEAVVFDWQSERVATAGGSCGVWVWQIAGSKTGTPVRRNGETRWIGVDGLAFSKDGRFLAVAAGRGHVIEIANPSNYTRFPAEGSDDDQQIESVAFSADGERLVTASRNGLDIWERNAPKQKPKHLAYHLLNQDSNEPVVSFGEDGYLVVGEDYEAHIWDVGGEPVEIGTIELQDVSTTNVYSSLVSPGAAFIATTRHERSAAGGETSVWQIQPAAVMANACARLNRPLSFSEWEKAFGKEPYRQTCDALPKNRN
jgi:WD40 repeat protein